MSLISPIASPEFTPEMRSRKSRFVPDAFNVERLVGLKLFTIRNKYGCYVIPSTENFVVGYKFPKLKVDEQANRTLLPILNTAMLRDLCCRFGQSKTDYSVSISKFMTRNSPVYAMTVKCLHKKAHFPMFLGGDVYPDNLVENGSFLMSQLARSSSSCATDHSDFSSRDFTDSFFPHFPSSTGLRPTGKCTFKVPRLDFFLCSEDIAFLVNSLDAEILECFANEDSHFHVLREHVSHAVIPRRDDGVLGNSILKRYSLIRHMNVEFVFNTTQHFLEDLTWTVLEETALQIHTYGYLSENSLITNEEEGDATNMNDNGVVLNSIWPNDIVFDADSTTGLYAQVKNANLSMGSFLIAKTSSSGSSSA